ncbi:MAG: hypothetical protein ABIQ16_19600 [Polyangiaceae bacterium]
MNAAEAMNLADSMPLVANVLGAIAVWIDDGTPLLTMSVFITSGIPERRHLGAEQVEGRVLSRPPPLSGTLRQDGLALRVGWNQKLCIALALSIVVKPTKASVRLALLEKVPGSVILKRLWLGAGKPR